MDTEFYLSEKELFEDDLINESEFDNSYRDSNEINYLNEILSY